eukprot:SAG31_NODE_5302_length_2621_cov_2.300159_2_plen_244_part_00
MRLQVVIWKVTLVRVVEIKDEVDAVREDAANVQVVGSRMHELGRLLGIAVPHLQVLSTLQMLTLHWPDFVLRLFHVLRILAAFDFVAILASVTGCDKVPLPLLGPRAQINFEDPLSGSLIVHLGYLFCLIFLAVMTCCCRGCCCCQVGESRRETSFHLRNNIDFLFTCTATMLSSRLASNIADGRDEEPRYALTGIYFVILPLILIRPLVVAKRAGTIDTRDVVQSHGWLILKYRTSACATQL